MKLNELSKEKLDILGALKTDDEIKAFIDNEDIELDMEELDSVSGGGHYGYQQTCEYCGKVCYGTLNRTIHELNCPSNPRIIKPAEPASPGTGTDVDVTTPTGGLFDKIDKIKEKLQ